MKLAVKMDPYETYQKYLALKTHFKSDTYDYFQYHGKLKGDRTKFETRRDKYYFYKLSKMKHAEDFMVANLIANPNFWPGDINNEGALKVYSEWIKRRDSLGYLFDTEIQNMDDDFDSNIKVPQGEHPRLLILYLRGAISPETIIILDSIAKFFPYWNKKLQGDIVWPDEYKKLKKYQPFFINNVDLDKYRSIIISRFENKP